MAEASDFKFCMQLGFAKFHPEEKIGVAMGCGLPKICVPL